MLKWFGVPVDIEPANSSAASSCAVVGPASFAGREVSIHGDFSSATFLITAAALIPGSDLQIEDVGLNPTRTQFLETLRSVGARIEVLEQREECNEPVGTIRIRSLEPGKTVAEGVPLTIGGQLIASLIDELPLMGVVGTQLPGGLVIRDAKELRFKETDRIAAVVKNLRAMGAEVGESEDGLAVGGPVRLKGALIDSCGDHRIAMAFSIAGLLAEGESEISNSECVGVSFPEFFECLETVVER
jgi:3-phosphoshikimate 1-carboxyvinyltransferase